jgi:hypothetical protein
MRWHLSIDFFVAVTLDLQRCLIQSLKHFFFVLDVSGDGREREKKSLLMQPL